MAIGRIEEHAGISRSPRASAGSRPGPWPVLTGPRALLLPIHAGFWALLVPVAGMLATVAVDHGDRGPDLIWTAGIAAAALVILALLLAGLWTILGRRGLEPSLPAKLSLGFVALALACLALALGVEWGLADAHVSGGALGACFVALALAELCVAPVGLTAMTALDESARPRRREGFRRGLPAAAWWSSAIVGAALSQPWEPPARGLEDALHACVGLGLLAVAAAVAVAFCWRPLARRPR